MRFALSEEQESLRRMVRRVLTNEMKPGGARRALAAEGYNAVLWEAISGELGLAGLTIPEQFGGAGLGWVELAAVMEELGYRLAMVPYLSTVGLAATALIHCGDSGQQAAWLPGIAAGEVRATLAWVGDVEVRNRGAGFVLDGRVRHVVDGHLADVIVVAASDGRLYAMKTDTPGIQRERLPTMDLTRPLAEVRLNSVRLAPDARLAGGSLEGVLALASIALAAEQVGGAQCCVDMGVSYAKEREQFGRPIGSFQAIQHMCADMFLQLESARSAAYYAAWVADQGADGGGELMAAAATAACYGGDAYLGCAGDNIQVHGGIGFTWEHDAHLYFKRARASRHLLGAPGERLEQVARLMGLGDA